MNYIDVLIDDIKKHNTNLGNYCIIFPDIVKWYKVDGLFHNESGPAVKYLDLTFNLPNEYYLKGIKFYTSETISSNDQWIKLVPKLAKLKAFL